MLEPERIIRRPRVTEKSHVLSERNATYVFDVDLSATKDQIKAAIERMYEGRKIHVAKVRTLIQRGKARRYRNIQGRTSTYKKAFVTLRPGETIDVV